MYIQKDNIYHLKKISVTAEINQFIGIKHINFV
jgi:hypothetical protein